MKYFVYQLFIFNILLFCFLPFQGYADEGDTEFLPQDNELYLDSNDSKKNDLPSIDSQKEPSFSSLKISIKKKKESISFDNEVMKINLKYIENR